LQKFTPQKRELFALIWVKGFGEPDKENKQSANSLRFFRAVAKTIEYFISHYILIN